MYRIQMTPTAEDDLAKLDKKVARRIADRLKWLAANFENVTPIPLQGSFRGEFKFRVGDYRVFYVFDRENRIITIRAIAHRSKAYRRR